MAGKIVADTLEHSTAGSIATNYVVDGSAKAWVIVGNAATTLTINASFNVSSAIDNGTGDFSYSLTNSFASALFIPVAAWPTSQPILASIPVSRSRYWLFAAEALLI